MLNKTALLVPIAIALTNCAGHGSDVLSGPPSLQSAYVAASAEQPNAGAVSSADPRASAAGDAMLAAGGSATDAAIAIMLALTVVEPQSSGIGGGGFMVRADAASGDIETFDGRETAPASATDMRFLDAQGEQLPRDIRVTSGLSVGVPGNLALAAKAHKAHGKLPWAQLFEPAIALAADGFKMNQRLHGSLSSQKDRAGKASEARAVYFGSDGEPLPVGTTIRVPALAEAMSQIAAQGAQHFYIDDAASLADYIAAETPQDGKISTTDITSYTAKLRDPVCGRYRAYTVCGMGPPSSGGIAVVQILGQLERFDLASLGPDSPQFWHLFLESQRVAYADRELYIGDSDFVSVPVEGLLDPDYIASRSTLISPVSKIADPQAGVPAGAPLARADGDEPVESGTSHFAVVDSAGNAISYTSTIEGAFGSGLFYRGFYLNNELTDFSLSPKIDGKPVANRVEGGKRPRSSMAPTIVFDQDGAVFLVIGAAGGPTIPVQTARSIIGVIDFGMTAQKALGLPLIMGFGQAAIIEKDTALEGMRDELAALGHDQIRSFAPPLKANALLRTDAGWEVATDPRIEPLLATE